METSLILRILYIPGEASLFTGGIEFYPLGRKPGRRLRERACKSTRNGMILICRPFFLFSLTPYPATTWNSKSEIRQDFS
jgi:hypothetical protein